jgi:very-short-patch-repair endonuclease
VKSLENVQGDERDVIFVSLTYGPDPATKRVAQRFGPLNSRFGARRLNVLFTRARELLVVFSSLKPEDLTVDDGASAGLQTLRSYLTYAAQSCKLQSRDDLGGAVDTSFASAVRATLEHAGHTIEARVGVQGFFIDLGIKSKDGSRFVCGVECDGESYHDHRSARDRERLRQELLEAQGWNIVRVWSTDWYRSPQAARHRLLQQIAAHVDGQRIVMPRIRLA